MRYSVSCRFLRAGIVLVETLWMEYGGRISEVLELTSQTINFDNGTITIRTLKKKKTPCLLTEQCQYGQSLLEA
ncbi:MAG: hypothetical protein SRB1_01701 [Desulfobacteraceae bacterium Eth-SRB1]|nr:MAG: hypothetical protein SRB1_01701 [Desulfobacteraceae bacterium Eth-SRB1]